jgi:hypothetical protein
MKLRPGGYRHREVTDKRLEKLSYRSLARPWNGRPPDPRGRHRPPAR